MQISQNRLKGLWVYEIGSEEPCGRVKGLCFSEDKNNIKSLQVETISLVPLCKNIEIEAFEGIYGKKIFLKKNFSFKEQNLKKSSSTENENISKIVLNNGKPKKIKDLRFDFETGEITDFYIDNGFFRRAKEYSVNKIQITDNTIYIETKGGE